MAHLIKIFTGSLALGYVPKSWQRLRVAFIPKPGRTAHGEVKDFRPTLERLVDFYIKGEEVLKRFPLHAHHHFYQISTGTTFYQLTRRVEEMMGKGKIALECFMDVEETFDNANFTVIEKAMKERKVKNAITLLL